MNCKTAREGLTEYLENALPSDLRQGLEAHLDSCDACASFQNELERSIHLTSKLPAEEMPDHMKRTLLEALRHRSSA